MQQPLSPKRALTLAAEAALDPSHLATTLAASLHLGLDSRRLLLASSPAGVGCLIPLACALRKAVPAVVLSVAVPTATDSAAMPTALLDEADIRTAPLDELHTVFGVAAFDAIALPGAVCAATLHRPAEPNIPTLAAAARDAVAAAARITHSANKALAPGGLLYLDCVPAGARVLSCEDRAVPASESTELVDVVWQYGTIDKTALTRQVSVKVCVHAGVDASSEALTMRLEHTELLATAEQLRSVVSFAGFTSFDAVVDGALQAARCGFVARCPANKEEYYDRALRWYGKVWNENGMINWGLFPSGFPSASFSPAVRALLTQMKTTNDNEGGGSGVMVQANLAFCAWIRGKVDEALAASDILVDSVLDVGCGTGRPTIELAHYYKDTLRFAVGVDPGHANIKAALASASSERERIGLQVEFCEGLVEDVMKVDKRQFALAWSESALAHAPPCGRRAAVHAIAESVKPGGLFMLNDIFVGHREPSARTSLHLIERLHFTGLWSLQQWIGELHDAGFRLLEYIDVTEHQASSYKALSEEAGRCAHMAEKGSDERFMFECLETDYKYSSIGSSNGECTWAVFICRKE